MQTTSDRLRRLMSRTRRPSEHLVSAGRVGCPRSALGDVDVERCLACPLLQDIRVDESARPWVSCRSAERLVTAAELRAI